MSERIFTLFGEELAPEQPKAAGKTRPKKKSEEKKEEVNTPAAQAQPIGMDAAQPTAAIVQEPVAEEPAAVVEQPVAATEAPVAAIQPEEERAPVAETVVVPEPAEPMPAPAEETTITGETETIPTEPIAAETTPPVEEKKKAKKEKVVIEEPTDGKQYYAIGEVADMFKVKTSHIRFWTTEFNLKVRTTRKGDRLYNMDQIKELRAIHHLVKERGFTLAGAKAKLKDEKKKIEVESVDLKKSLQHLRAKLVAIKNQLK